MKWGPQAGPLQAANWKPCQKWEDEAERGKQEPLAGPPHYCEQQRTLPEGWDSLHLSHTGVLPPSWEDLGAEALGHGAWQSENAARMQLMGLRTPAQLWGFPCSVRMGCLILWRLSTVWSQASDSTCLGLSCLLWKMRIRITSTW